MSLYLRCNLVNCRKAIKKEGWTTSCSHIFCDDHTPQVFKKGCPACGEQLPNAFDLVRANLDPSDSFKSVALAGLKPPAVLDIAERALSYWSYQIGEEAAYRQTKAAHVEEAARAAKVKGAIAARKFETDLGHACKKIEKLRAEAADLKRKAQEKAVAIENKNRSVQRLRQKLQCLKRKPLYSRLPPVQPKSPEFPRTTLVTMLAQQRDFYLGSPETTNFNFKPKLSSDKRARQYRLFDVLSPK